MGQQDGRGCLLPMPEGCGPIAWEVLHGWARAVHDDLCPSCGEEAISLASLMHDLVNVKLGRPPQAPKEALRWAPLFHQLTGGKAVHA